MRFPSVSLVRGFVLQQVPYGEKGFVVRLFTREGGVQPFISHTGRSREGGMRLQAHLYPLALLEVSYQPGKRGEGLHRLLGVEGAAMMLPLRSDPVKGCVATYMAELLGLLVQRPGPQCDLFDYVEEATRTLSALESGMAYFPHRFTLGIAKVLGYEPQGDFSVASPLFSIPDAGFTATEGQTLSPETSALLAQLLGDGWPPASRALRNQLLKELVDYLAYHTDTPLEIASLEVLDQIFGG